MWIEQDSTFLNAQFEHFSLKQQYWQMKTVWKERAEMERIFLDADVTEVIKFQPM